MSLPELSSLTQSQMSQFVRELRQLLGLTQEEFGKKIGVSYETVSRWENGKMQPSSLALRQLGQVMQELDTAQQASLQLTLTFEVN